MEPKKQVEIQLGHMCNNRCVFCVSGQQTERGNARPLEVPPLLAEIEAAYAKGHRKITLLGGEPTLQPGFLDVVRRAVALGFEEIVIFTNGVKTARAAFIDEILATGGNFTWRISLQGATKESHEATTKKPGSFDRILRTMETLRAKGERITVNMCVVRSNHGSVGEFPKLLLPIGARQLHIDMVRPLDAGERSEDELREMMPRYGEMVPELTRMIKGFPDGFDVNVGNLPYCVAPELARWVHHDGELTETIAVDGPGQLSRPWDKYFVKRRDKLKPSTCAECVFDARCSGIFETYEKFYGTDELVPVTPERLRAVDPEEKLLALHLKPSVRALEQWTPPEPFLKVVVSEASDAELRVTLVGVDALTVVLSRASHTGAAGFSRFSLHIAKAPRDKDLALAGLRALAARLAAMGHEVVHPVGDDAFVGVARSIAARLAKLRQLAPYGALRWTDVVVSEGGRRAEAAFVGPEGERATVWLTEQGGKPAGGYRVDGDTPTPALVEGLRAVIGALRGAPAPAAGAAVSVSR